MGLGGGDTPWLPDHGKKYLNHVFSMLMMLAFLIDQCLQRLNKRFQEALERCGGKKYLWERMLHSLYIFSYIPNLETLYEAIIRPPPILLRDVA
ncbi:MAG: hypothetical protein A2W46_06525 [Alphaproteobacteria bacterium RIFCSPHIGHO2_12_42_13]|nr:MAG: hypothetical protein A3C41_04790 [Alphaproteobacteria bacterium RIFCSPHIGHO2_02_FULL_42_30]OFW92632.1 MAG: hypothetical protein A2W46_06525 [Alphaproteobacteria bacterium RIFCSPHIGHO2_12_42_13]